MLDKKLIDVWMGITYPAFDGWLPKWVYGFWKNKFCSRGWHLLDETWSQGEHYLYCDACGLYIYIDDDKTIPEYDKDWP